MGADHVSNRAAPVIVGRGGLLLTRQGAIPHDVRLGAPVTNALAPVLLGRLGLGGTPGA
jgi:hypothetical protein